MISFVAIPALPKARATLSISPKVPPYISPRPLIEFDNNLDCAIFKSNTAPIVLIDKSAFRKLSIIAAVAPVTAAIPVNNKEYPTALLAAWIDIIEL